VAPVEWNVWAARLPGAAPGLLRSLVGRSEPAVSAHGVDRALVDRLRTASGGARSAEVTAYVVARLAEVLDLEPDRLEPDRALDTLGLDSLMAVELRSRFRRDLGAEVSLTVLLSDDRVDALAVHLAAALETRTGDEPESATTAGDGEAARESLALVDEMTDEEVDAMLAGLELEVGDRAGEPGRDPEGDGTDESPGGAR
jgi:acyl carrier protein